MDSDEKKLMEDLKAYFDKAAADPVVRHHEKTLVRSLRPRPVLVSFGLPVMALAGVAFLFFHFHNPLAPVQMVTVPEKPVVSPALTPTPSPVLSLQDPASQADDYVKVKQVSSKVGSTLVYQKRQGTTPLTIVWVFVRTP